jgi:hypothetical protein
MKKTRQKAPQTTQESPTVRPAGGTPTPEEIQQRAHQLYLARGAADGRDLDDWLQAERELKAAKDASAL